MNSRDDVVKMRRIETFEYLERAERISGILMEATEPVAARRMWVFPSEAWEDALKAV